MNTTGPSVYLARFPLLLAEMLVVVAVAVAVSVAAAVAVAVEVALHYQHQ